METKLEIITPEQAQEYLAHNTNNRRIKGSNLDTLVRAIKNNEFRTTHQGIAFDGQGNLVDGQHRLLACVLAKKPIKVLVTRGLDEAEISAVDTGSSRNYTDIMRYTGIGSDDVVIRNQKVASAVRKLVKNAYNQGMDMAFDEIVSFINRFHKECEQLYTASCSRSANVADVNAAALAALMCGESYDDIFNFFTVFNRGETKDCDNYNISAAFNWRNQIANAKIKHMAMSSNRLYLGTQNAIWNFIHADGTRTIKTPKNARYPMETFFKMYFKENAK